MAAENPYLPFDKNELGDILALMELGLTQEEAIALMITPHRSNFLEKVASLKESPPDEHSAHIKIDPEFQDLEIDPEIVAKEFSLEQLTRVEKSLKNSIPKYENVEFETTLSHWQTKQPTKTIINAISTDEGITVTLLDSAKQENRHIATVRFLPEKLKIVFSNPDDKTSAFFFSLDRYRSPEVDASCAGVVGMLIRGCNALTNQGRR